MYTSHGTLTAGTAKQVSVTPGTEGIVIVNRSDEGYIWVRFDGTNPEPFGDDSYIVIGSRQFPLDRRSLQRAAAGLDVRLISQHALDYSVEAVGVPLT